MMIKKVTVFCASSQQVAQKYFDATQTLGKVLAQNDITTIYGGGEVGLMGHLADTILKENGKIIGVIPEFMINVEWGHKNITEMIVVESMRERKHLMYHETDAVIALPGGVGTLEELLEVITLKRLGQFIKPIIIVNVDGYYDPLVKMLEKCVTEKFMKLQHRKMWVVLQNPENIIDAIENAPEWSQEAIQFAVLTKED